VTPTRWPRALAAVMCLAAQTLAPAVGRGVSAAPAAAPATAQLTPPPAAALAKKDRLAEAKSTRHGPPPAAGTRPVKLVNLYNFWTKEWLAIDATSRPAPATVDRFLRDHFTNQRAAMQPKLVDIVLAAAASFHTDVVDVVSGFRHPKYNLILRKKGHQVARDSQHTHGNAIDFYLPNVTAQALEAWARAQKIGGVGLYPESGFVHMDTGPVRYWSGE
jgi:uncharacterized protein YcbK (DUF882 family)